jgi:fructuronate reductase
VSGGRLSRATGHGRPAAPVRLVHLGLGNFFRAHQCWYTEHAPDSQEWGIAAFSGRSTALPDALAPQDGLFTLVTRAADGDRFDVVSSLSRAHPAADHEAWLAYLADPEVRGVTLTVTEAGYLPAPGGGLDRERPEVRADVESLRRDPAATVQTVPARLLAGLAARRRAGAGPIALIPCDNLPDNGAVAARSLLDLAEMVDPDLVPWLRETVATVTTMVDRITPRTTAEDVRAVAEATGLEDRAPVVTEPFHEWVLSGTFPAGRPGWDEAGATITDDITPFEHRKLWLLNGAHSLLAYGGLAHGYTTVGEAVSDDTARHWLEQWWDEASRYLTLPAEDLAAYRSALLERFANARMHHRLDQISADGSQKLPVRILPTLRHERAAGRLPQGAVHVLGAWVCHLRGGGGQVDDVRADRFVPLAQGPLPTAVRRVVDALDPDLAADDEVVATVLSHAEHFEGLR